MTVSASQGSATSDSRKDVMAHLTLRIDRLEREVRWRKGVNAALLVGAALLVTSGLSRPAALAARPAAGRAKAQTSLDPLAEAEAELALKALKLIGQPDTKGAGVLSVRHGRIAVWSRRFALARLHTLDDEASRVALMEAHLARMRELEARTNAHYRERRLTDLERMETEYFRREAEQWAARVKAGLPPWPVWVSY
jgi:hypothetical protein